MKVIYWVSMVLVLIGALNWALVGLFEFDLVEYLFSSVMTLARVIYVLVGVAGLIVFFSALSGKEA